MSKVKGTEYVKMEADAPGLGVIKNKAERAKLKAAIIRLREIAVEADLLKKEKAGLSVDVECIFVDHGIKNMKFDDLSTSYFQSSNSQIKAALLLQKGVDPAVIAACTVKTPYSVVTVRQSGDRDGE